MHVLKLFRQQKQKGGFEIVGIFRLSKNIYIYIIMVSKLWKGSNERKNKRYI